MDGNVSIIIPTYNRKKLLAECLESLSLLTYTDYEVIVVDDASSDGTCDVIAASFPSVTIIRNSRRRGPAYCKNQGIMKSEGEFLWFLDSDSVIVHADCLAHMVTILTDTKNAGCVGGELLEEGGARFVRIDETDISKKVLLVDAEKDRLTMLKVRSLMTCNLCTRKKIVTALGGFDTNFFYMSEDTDICERCRNLGYDILLDHRTLVLHQYSRIARRSTYYLLFRNELRCAVKNRGISQGLLQEPARLFRNIFHAAQCRTKDMSRSINIIPLSPHKRPAVLGVLRLAFTIGVGALCAYVWNIMFLYKTLIADKRTDYLKSTVL